MTDPTPQRRPFLTPSWLIYGLLVVEGLLWLSERYRWFWFNERKGFDLADDLHGVGISLATVGPNDDSKHDAPASRISQQAAFSKPSRRRSRRLYRR